MREKHERFFGRFFTLIAKNTVLYVWLIFGHIKALKKIKSSVTESAFHALSKYMI
jgi:hypothetical protein